MIVSAGPYSLLKRLTIAFSIVALLVFALVSGFLYHCWRKNFNAAMTARSLKSWINTCNRLTTSVQHKRYFEIAPGSVKI